jgi:hypothetical protein
MVQRIEELESRVRELERERVDRQSISPSR